LLESRRNCPQSARFVDRAAIARGARSWVLADEKTSAAGEMTVARPSREAGLAGVLVAEVIIFTIRELA